MSGNSLLTLPQQPFHDHYVEPAPELVTHFPLDAHQDKAGPCVERLRGHVRGVADAGNHSVIPELLRPRHDLVEQYPADAAAAPAVFEIDRVLNRGVVRRAGAEDREAAPA